MITIENMTKMICDSIEDKLGKDIAVLNIGKVSSICDYFIIASGTSSRQVKSISDSVEDAMKKIGVEARGKEGRDTQSWILLDYGDIMVHIFDEENRGFYNLEKLWKDAPQVEMEELESIDVESLKLEI